MRNNIHLWGWVLIAASVFAAAGCVTPTARITAGELTYRGFDVDVSAIRNPNRLSAVESSLQHQIDIVADCGAKPEVMAFFRSQKIFLKPGVPDEFDSSKNVIELNTVRHPPEKPVLLHELLHSYHFNVLPKGFRNPEILYYFNHAKDNNLYPANEYLLKNPAEFFAVTASLYLWGNVDRAPHTRENLRAKQPYYYAWLGHLFGVEPPLSGLISELR